MCRYMYLRCTFLHKGVNYFVEEEEDAKKECTAKDKQPDYETDHERLEGYKFRQAEEHILLK